MLQIHDEHPCGFIIPAIRSCAIGQPISNLEDVWGKWAKSFGYELPDMDTITPSAETKIEEIEGKPLLGEIEKLIAHINKLIEDKCLIHYSKINGQSGFNLLQEGIQANKRRVLGIASADAEIKELVKPKILEGHARCKTCNRFTLYTINGICSSCRRWGFFLHWKK